MSWLKSERSRRQSASKSGRAFRCESLESRQMLAGDVLHASSDSGQLPGGWIPEANGSGFPPILPDLEPAAVSGMKWHDANGDGSRGDDEVGLAGVTIYSDLNTNGTLDWYEPQTVTQEDDPLTDADETGQYTLSGLTPGYHVIREVVPSGFRQTYPETELPPGYLYPPWGALGAHVVFAEAGETVSEVNFGNQELPPSSVLGSKWEDLNGNGVRDDNEPGLAGVTIYVDVNRNGVLDDDEPSTVTQEDIPETDFDEEGLYWLEDVPAGLQVIREVVPDGYQQTYPRLAYPEPFPIPLPGFEGNPDDLVEDALSGPAAYTMWRDGLENTTTDAVVDLATGDMNEDGSVDHHDYDSWKDDHFFPGWVPIWPGEGDGHVLWVEPGTSVDGIDFGNQKIEPGSISGAKWLDLNGNAEWDPNESGVAGITIYLDLNYSGTWDDDEPSTVTAVDDPTTAVDESGSYRFDDLDPGLYAVAEVIPDGFEQTYPRNDVWPWGFVHGDPVDLGILPHVPGSHFVSVGSGSAITDIDFGNREIVPGVIEGTKWNDLDGDGERDGNEPGLAGVTIYLDLNFNGSLDPDEPSVVTTEDIPETDFDEGGMYRFEDLSPGSYSVREVIPDGYEQTFPNYFIDFPTDILGLPNPGDGAGHFVFVTSGAVVSGIDFGNWLPQFGSVTGVKWLDANGDGLRNEGEPGLAGVTIYADLDRDGRLDPNEPSTVTWEDDAATPNNDTGRYVLEGLRPGEYLIREIVPERYEQTFPRAPGTDVEPPVAASDEFATVEPGVIELEIDAAGIAVGSVSITIHPEILTQIELDIRSEDLPLLNLSGIQANGGGGDVTTFDFFVLGPVEGIYELQFVDLSGGEAIATVPMVLGAASGDTGHEVIVRPDERTAGIDFGNRRLPDPEPAGVFGRVWDDADGSGTVNDEERGMGGVTVYSDVNQNGLFDADDLYVITSEDDPTTDQDEAGWYELLGLEAGSHTIRQIVPDGFDQTFPESPIADDFPAGPYAAGHHVELVPGEILGELDFGNQAFIPGSIEGRKWEDLNGDGVWDAGEPGLGGVTIYLDLNFNGALDDDEPTSVTLEEDPFTDFDEGGLYSFGDLRPGGYAVREVVPEGYEQTFPQFFWTEPTDPLGLIFLPPGSHFVAVASGDVVSDINFGNWKPETGSLSGLKWLDENGDGERNADEPGLAGVTIYIDVNGNGRPDVFEPQTETRGDDPDTERDETGQYVFEGIRPGNYVVREVVPSGYQQTFPVAEPIDLQPSVPLDPEFATLDPEVVYVEADETGVFIGEVSVTVHPEIFRPIELDLMPGELAAINLSGPQANGGGGQTTTFQFLTFVPGNGVYELELVDLFNGEVFGTVPVVVGDLQGSAGHEVTITPNERVTDVNFGNQPTDDLEPAGVIGRVWEDPNRDGVRQDDERGMGGTIVYSDLNVNGQRDEDEPFAITTEDDPTTTQDESGFYELVGLIPGTHWIQQELPEGYRQTHPDDAIIAIFPPPPTAGSQEVELSPGEVVAGIDFGNTINELAEPLAGRSSLSAENPWRPSIRDMAFAEL